MIKKSISRQGLRRAIKGSLFVYALGAMLAFASQILLARLMGVTEYGVYYYALSWFLIIAMFSQFGLDQTLLRFMPVYIQDGDWSRAKGIFNASNRLVFGNGMLMGVLMLLVVLALGDRLEASQRNAFLLAAFCLPLRGLIYVRQATLRSFMFTIRSLLPDAVIVPVVLMILAVSLSLVNWVPTAPVIMAATLIALIISFLVGAYWQSRLVPKQLVTAKQSYEVSAWLRVAFMMLIINGTYMLLNNVDLLILGLYRSPDEVGIYGVSARIASIVTFILIATYPVFAPLITKQHAAGGSEELQQEITHVMRPIALIAIVLAVFLMVAGGAVLGLFGEEFDRGHTALCILLAGQLVNALCGPVALLLAYGGHENVVVKVLIIAVIMDIGLNFLAIQNFGMEGAATATAVSTVFWNLMLYVLTRRHLGIDSSGWFTARAVQPRKGIVKS